jgi:amidase
MSEPHELTALEQWQSLQSGELGVRELTDHYLARIDRLNPELGAFYTVTPEAARQRAHFVEANVAKTAPLWGLPFGDKDLSRRAGVLTTFGSRLFADFVPEESDELPVTMDNAGGVSLGKTATPEFGLPSYTESLVAPPARNPYLTSTGAGGSSGGAAVAVAAGMLPFAPGSDGGGSIRIPAAVCGLVGLKPSRGLVPAGSGIESLAGLPVAGPLARTVADAALLLDGMISRSSGRIDHHFTLRAPDGDGAPYLSAALRGEGRYQLGVLTGSPWSSAYDLVLDPAAQSALDLAVAEFSAMGHGIDGVELPETPEYSEAFRTIWQAGAAGIPVDERTRHLVEPLTAWLVDRGRSLSAAQLATALAQLSAFERRIIALFGPYDAIMTPTLAQEPRPVGWYDSEDGERNFAQQVIYTPFTSFVNVAGLPAITLPVSVAPSGAPMGVQLIGRPGGESTLLALGAQLERRIRWGQRHPASWG